MTWLRFDTDAAQSDVVGHLAEALGLPVPHAFGCYVACCLAFGAHRPDGRADGVTDTTLEQWACWTGKRGRFAAAFRARCVDEDGVVRGWWRQTKLIERQQEKNRRPGPKERETRQEPGKNPAPKSAGDETKRDVTRESSQKEEGAEPQEPPAPVSLPYLVQCVKALNAGLAENPRLNGYREVSASEQAGTVTWEGEGIPVALACATIRRIARAYKPKATSRQPSSLRYFDAAVREEFTGEKKQGQAAPALGKWENPHKDRRPGALTVSLADLAPRRGQEPIGDVLARIVPTAPEAA